MTAGQNPASYYTDFAKALPEDTVILTAGCAKYRYNKLPLGDIGGIPRILDAGQCNDSYSLAVIALKFKEVFGLEDINDLPIIYNIAWYEQKAVIVLLSLLYLGVKNIHLGPTLPAFLSSECSESPGGQFRHRQHHYAGGRSQTLLRGKQRKLRNELKSDTKNRIPASSPEAGI